MATLTANVNVNVDARIKEEATYILKDLGLNMSTAINMYLTQIVKRNGIPFEVVNPEPSDELKEALQELEYMKKHPEEYKSYDNVHEMFKELDEEIANGDI